MKLKCKNPNSTDLSLIIYTHTRHPFSLYLHKQHHITPHLPPLISATNTHTPLICFFTMVSSELARTAVGIIGNVIALILFLSPVSQTNSNFDQKPNKILRPTFIQIVKKRTVEQFSPVPYLATFINCGVWVLYGLPVVHPHSFLVITINGTGLLIETAYLLLFLIYCDRKQRIKMLLIIAGELVFLGVLSALVLTVAHSTKVRSDIVGSIAIVGNIMMYASPLSVMKLVITTKSVEYMPFFLSLFSMLNGISWTIYALIRFDPYIVIPNGLGSLLGITQLILYATFYKSTQRQLAARKANAEMGLAETGT
ncbi:bidirectional sugar transporter SWEET4 isoform X1 [Lactuca sativa]|uniref:bidirectional sugar transporter SWEET4 isoform X1 n=1 Tax=Lactuca sativa TaxID=4236 RepID=UPI001C688861|nr:bidirectional sugar transporter SWEET4 isoform X1 [Lactuca sativa]